MTNLKEKTNEKEKSHKCNQCTYESSRRSDFRVHLQIHSGEKPNKCSQCEYASFRADGLRTHLKKTQWRKVVQMLPM